jgi:hypothetical protein
MKRIVFLILTILLTFPAQADEGKETCRSYVIVAPENTKYCLLDQDEKIAEFDRKLHEEQNTQWLDELQKNDIGPFPEQPAKQAENQ